MAVFLVEMSNDYYSLVLRAAVLVLCCCVALLAFPHFLLKVVVGNCCCSAHTTGPWRGVRGAVLGVPFLVCFVFVARLLGRIELQLMHEQTAPGAQACFSLPLLLLMLHHGATTAYVTIIVSYHGHATQGVGWAVFCFPVCVVVRREHPIGVHEQKELQGIRNATAVVERRRSSPK